jgi:hypothetical protein
VGRLRRRPEVVTYHVAVMPSGLGATFRVQLRDPAISVTWSYDTGVRGTSRDSIIVERAAAELRAALGDRTAEVATPRPAWMGSFLWVPSLPGE